MKSINEMQKLLKVYAIDELIIPEEYPQPMQYDLQDTLKTALAMVDMLRKVEWIYTPSMSRLGVNTGECLICGGVQNRGHLPDCELGQMIKELEGEHEKKDND
jgi:hypothetical protein